MGVEVPRTAGFWQQKDDKDWGPLASSERLLQASWKKEGNSSKKVPKNKEIMAKGSQAGKPRAESLGPRKLQATGSLRYTP